MSGLLGLEQECLITLAIVLAVLIGIGLVRGLLARERGAGLDEGSDGQQWGGGR
jgi:hypothetical protein